MGDTINMALRDYYVNTPYKQYDGGSIHNKSTIVAATLVFKYHIEERATTLAAPVAILADRWPRRPTVDGDAYIAITERKLRRLEYL